MQGQNDKSRSCNAEPGAGRFFSKPANERTRLLGKYLRLQPDDQAAPMPAVDGDRHGQVVHDLTGVPHIRLKKHGRCVRCTALIALGGKKEAHMPALQEVGFVVSRHRFGNMRMMHG